MVTSSVRLAVLGLLMLLVTGSSPSFAQDGPFRAVSVNVRDLVNRRMTLDYETCGEHERDPDADLYIPCLLSFGTSVTAGKTPLDQPAGAPPRSTGYVDADAFVRLLLSDKPFDGWSIDLKAGLTRVAGDWPRPGVGAALNRSWRVGRHLYLGTGAGIKRVFGIDRDTNLTVIPHLRMNVGVAF